MSNIEFIKVGNKILPKDEGLDYKIEPGKIYDLRYNGFSGEFYIVESDVNLVLPEKIFDLKRDKNFRDRILTYYNNTNKKNIGVMLAGVKGTGKTLCAKLIAKESKLPILIPDESIRMSKLYSFFDKIKNTEFCILFDEIEKKYDTEEMLSFLDGLSTNSKKLIIMTCNELNKVSKYMKDRCSRIRYLREYSDTENIELINEVLLYNGIQGKELKDVSFYIKNYMNLLSIDNITSFIEEYVLFKDKYTLDELFSIMNLTRTNRNFDKENYDENNNDKKKNDEKLILDANNINNYLNPVLNYYNIRKELFEMFLDEVNYKKTFKDSKQISVKPYNKFDDDEIDQEPCSCN